MKYLQPKTAVSLLVVAFWLLQGCTPKMSSSAGLSPDQVNKTLEYCETQARKAVAKIPAFDQVPRRINAGQQTWEYVSVNDWTSGFWPGILWYVYENDQDPFWKEKAEGFTQALAPILVNGKWDHDLGFMFYCS